MSFFWVIIILSALLLIAIDPRSFGGWRQSWLDLGAFGYDRPVTDLELRSEYRRRDCRDIPFVHRDEIPGLIDPTLDLLIYEDRLEEANSYRIRQLQIARERRDRDAMRSYEAYKNLIVRRSIELEELRRKTMKYDYKEMKKKAKAESEAPSSPMALAGETVSTNKTILPERREEKVEPIKLEIEIREKIRKEYEAEIESRRESETEKPEEEADNNEKLIQIRVT